MGEALHGAQLGETHACTHNVFIAVWVVGTQQEGVMPFEWHSKKLGKPARCVSLKGVVWVHLAVSQMDGAGRKVSYPRGIVGAHEYCDLFFFVYAVQ